MYKILRKKELNKTVVLMEIEAPFVAKKAEAGQFVILRVSEDGERIPLTISGYNREKGLVRIIFQVVGETTFLLSQKNEGDYLCDFVGPLGNATDTDGIGSVCVVGGGVGTAIALPVAEKLKSKRANVTSIIGFRTSELVILEDEFKRCSNEFYLVTDDGTAGDKGNVCVPLEQMLKDGKHFDMIFAIGPLVMMKYVTLLAKKYNVPCTVSMNPIMIDGTGMCGGCRLTVNGKTKFACVDGPDFNGFEVDFDEMIQRNKTYLSFERHRYEKTCNLFLKEGK